MLKATQVRWQRGLEETDFLNQTFGVVRFAYHQKVGYLKVVA